MTGLDRRCSLQPVSKESRVAARANIGHVYWDDMEDGNRMSITTNDDDVDDQPRVFPPHGGKDSKFSKDTHRQYVPSFPTGCKGLFQLMESPILLIMIGFFSACCVLLVDCCITFGIRFRYSLAHLSFVYLLFYSVGMACLAAAVVSIISPEAAGSGLPEMKVAISGVVMKKYLSFRCFSAKIIGLILASASGLSIGKEGPFIMITCAFAEMVMSVPIYQRIKEDSSKHLEMLACACAAAVSATFGTPFGGVLFSVEVTSTFYMVRNLPRSFFAAIVGAVTMSLLGQHFGFSWVEEATSLGIGRVSSSSTSSKDHPATLQDIAVFGLIGIVCGILGACFTAVVSELVLLRNFFLESPTPVIGQNRALRWWETAFARKVLLAGAVSAFSVFIEYFGGRTWFFKRGSQKTVFDLIFTSLNSQDDLSLYDRLQLFFPLKLILTALCVTLPVPAGIFAPTFLIGGVVGRILGQMCALHLPWLTSYHPHEFAIIAAAAFSSGVTRAISTAVIVLELGNSSIFSIPVSTAILAAYFTGGRFIENIYDILISTNQLPRLKKLPKAAYDIPTWEVMIEVANMDILTAESTYRDAQRLLQSSSEPTYPIVNDSTNMLFLGSVSRTRLEDAVRFCVQNDDGDKPSRSAASMRSMSLKHASSEHLVEASQRQRCKSSYAHESALLKLLDWPIQFAFMQGGKCIRWGTQTYVARTKMTVLVNTAPFQIVESMPMHKVDLIFRMLKVSHAYVTRCGRLVGCVTRGQLMNFLSSTGRYRQPGVCRTVTSTLMKCFSRIINYRRGYRGIV